MNSMGKPTNRGDDVAATTAPRSMRLALIRSGFGLRADPGIRAQVRRFIRDERAVRNPQTFDDCVRSIPEQTGGGFGRG
jgi:hypothetical protein